MSAKIINVNGVGNISFYKHKNSKSIRLRINGSNVKVIIPSWMPYKVAANYAASKKDWINNNISKSIQLNNLDYIGKQHQLIINQTNNLRYSSKINHNKIKINLPINMPPDSLAAQSKICKTVNEVLRLESEELIIPKVRQFAKEYGFIVEGISIKNLKSRWGSCSNKKDLTFSLYLIQLPWSQIDYVIFHELIHTKHLNHSPAFWKLLQQYIPNYKRIKIMMNNYAPQITPINPKNMS